MLYFVAYFSYSTYIVYLFLNYCLIMKVARIPVKACWVQSDNNLLRAWVK